MAERLVHRLCGLERVVVVVTEQINSETGWITHTADAMLPEIVMVGQRKGLVKMCSMYQKGSCSVYF